MAPPVAAGATVRETRNVSDIAVGMHDWALPSAADRLAPPVPRRKRSRVALWELIATPVTVTAWGLAIFNGLFYDGPAIDQQGLVASAFFGVSAIFLMGLVLIVGVALGLVVTAAVGTLYGFSARIPRTSAWVSSALVAIWCAAAIVLWRLFLVGLGDLASPTAP